MKNKILFVIVVLMIPFVVVSFFKDEKSEETNFLLPKKEDITVKILRNDVVETLDLEEYIIGVVAGEIPASFEEEALKAQAVASRTYALYKKNNESGEYDLTDNINSQVYIDKEGMKQKWQNEYQKYYDKIQKAVNDTKGLVMYKNEEVIEAFYFAMSNGNTQSAENIFNASYDYLVPVEYKYDNSALNNYEVVVDFEQSEIINKLGLTCLNIIIGEIKRNESNYIENINICDKVFKGTEVRKSLGFRSTDFDIEITDAVYITTRGYGHGVGMSQYGANGYAKNGYNYEEILKHYYNDIEIKSV